MVFEKTPYLIICITKMKIAVICSLTFSKEAGLIKKKLEEKGHHVSLPYSVERVLQGEMTVEGIESMKKDGSFNSYVISNDLIRWNWERMKKDEAVLVVNLEKKGIKGYIGGNTFLEIGLAYINNMKIFLWNDIPNIEYFKDELTSMSPIILNEKVDLIS